jgi:hypothetical protein
VRVFEQGGLAQVLMGINDIGKRLKTFGKRRELFR